MRYQRPMKHVAQRLIAALLSFALTAAPALADAPLTRYRAESLSLRVEGLGGQPALMRDGVELDYGFFGQDGELHFAGSPAALDHLESFQDMRTGGFIAWVVGLTTLTTVLVILLAEPDVFYDDALREDPNALFWGLLIGGGVVGVSGGLVMQAANTHLSDAVDAFNADLFERLDAGPAPSAAATGWTPRLTLSGRF